MIDCTYLMISIYLYSRGVYRSYLDDLNLRSRDIQYIYTNEYVVLVVGNLEVDDIPIFHDMFFAYQGDVAELTVF